MDKPSIGRIVWYRSRTGAYTVPAMITATTETLAPGAVEAGIIPALSSPTHVHLTVFSPGIPEHGVNATQHGDVPYSIAGLPPGARSFNLAGTYQEWDVPFFDPRDSGMVGNPPERALPVSCAPTPGEWQLEPLAGSWTWPERS